MNNIDSIFSELVQISELRRSLSTNDFGTRAALATRRLELHAEAARLAS